MTYADIIARLGIKQVCLSGDCGLNDYRHLGMIFLDVIHWRERRVTRRGLRRFLLLVAKRARLSDPTMLNEARFDWFYLWYDEQGANDLAADLGIRFPVEFSRTERVACRYYAHKRGIHLATEYPAVYAWASRGLDR